MHVSNKKLDQVCNAKEYAFYLLNIDIATFCKYRINIVSKLKVISKQH